MKFRVKKWMEPKSTVRVMVILASAFLAICVIGSFTYLFAQDATRWGKFPPNTKVCGVDVSGLSKQDAVTKCETELKDIANTPVTLTLDGAKYQAAPDALGLHLDYSKMVDQAYDQAWTPNVLERMFRSFTNRPTKVNGIIIAENSDALVSQFVTKVFTEVNRPPRNAYVDVTSGAPVIVQARDGYAATAESIRQEVVDAENSKTRTIEIQATKTPASFNADAFNKLIVVVLDQHMLYLYDKQTPVAQFPIACGQPAYPTPVGQWQVVSKQMNPTWYNPHSAWSSTMPETIGPGYSNPLGIRAMALDASGVLIHGSSNDGSIGTSASHGCMRMHMPDVVKLFDMVEQGIPVYIIHAAGNPGFDVTATPSWMKRRGTPQNTNLTGD